MRMRRSCSASLTRCVSLTGFCKTLLTYEADEAPGPDGKSGKDDDDWVATHIGRSKLLPFGQVLNRDQKLRSSITSQTI